MIKPSVRKRIGRMCDDVDQISKIPIDKIQDDKIVDKMMADKKEMLNKITFFKKMKKAVDKESGK